MAIAYTGNNSYSTYNSDNKQLIGDSALLVTIQEAVWSPMGAIPDMELGTQNQDGGWRQQRETHKYKYC